MENIPESFGEDYEEEVGEPVFALSDEFKALLATSKARKKQKEKRKAREFFEWSHKGVLSLQEVLTQERLKREELYGPEAAEIETLEVALNSTFDEICDREQPPEWPVNPIRNT